MLPPLDLSQIPDEVETQSSVQQDYLVSGVGVLGVLAGSLSVEGPSICLQSVGCTPWRICVKLLA